MAQRQISIFHLSRLLFASVSGGVKSIGPPLSFFPDGAMRISSFSVVRFYLYHLTFVRICQEVFLGPTDYFPEDK